MNVENAPSGATESLVLDNGHAAQMVQSSFNARLTLSTEKDALLDSCAMNGEWIGSTQEAMRLASIMAELDGLIDLEIDLDPNDGREVETTIDVKLAGLPEGATVRVSGDSDTVIALQEHLHLFEFDDSRLVALPNEADVVQVFGENQALEELQRIVDKAWSDRLEHDLAKCAENARVDQRAAELAQNAGRARPRKKPVMADVDPTPKIDPEARARRIFAAKDGKHVGDGPSAVWGETRRTADEIDANIRALKMQSAVMQAVDDAKAGRGTVLKLDADFDFQTFFEQVVLGLQGEH